METKRPLIWAHRGARSVAPENTLAAGRVAAEQKAHGWEIDIRMTSDGQFVVLHDMALDRTTDAGRIFGSAGPHNVSSYTFDQLKRLSFGSWFWQHDPFQQISSGTVSSELAASYCGEAVTTLAQAMDLARKLGLMLNIEIKDMEGHLGDSIVDSAAEAIAKAGLLPGSMMSCFRFDYLVRFRELLPDFPVGYLVADITEEVLEQASHIRAEAIHPDHTKLKHDMARQAMDAGFDLNVWTVNEGEAIGRLHQWGVTGLISDFPGRAKDMVYGRH